MSQQGSFPAKPDGLTYPRGTGPTQTQFARRSGRLHKAAALIAFGDTAHRQGRAEVVSPRRHRNNPGSGLCVGTNGDCRSANRGKGNVLSQQSRVGWDSFHNADDGDLGATPDGARFGSQPGQRSASGRAPERCQKDAGNSAGQRTLPREGRWRLRSPDPSQYSRVSEG